MKIQITVILITAASCMLSGDAILSCLFLSLCIAALCEIHACQCQRQEKQLEELVTYLMKVQDGLKLPELAECREGQMGILQSEIYKLVIQLKEQAGAADRQKMYLADMLSDISHQIKTPLAAITIMTDLLQQPGLKEDKRLEFVEKMQRQVNKISWLIRSLLTLSQLEADVIQFKKESTKIAALINSVCQSLELLAEIKGVELIQESLDDGISAVCDYAWTSEALSNIIKNCLEHTPRGGTVRICAQQNNFGTTVTIRDTGCGIAKEDLAHIFERFYKGRKDAKDSAGIGLAMAKQVILRQNGTIHAESEEGKGSTFIVRLYSSVQI